MLLIVQKDLLNITNFVEKLSMTEFDDKKIFTTSQIEDIEKYLKSGDFSYLIIDAKMYNFEISTLTSKYDIKTIITNATNAQKTIRMITDKNISYINSDVSPNILYKMITPKELTPFERVSI